MKSLFYIITLISVIIVLGCNSAKKSSSEKVKSVVEKNSEKTESDTIRIANPDLEYEVIIIDGGFRPWLQSTAKPRNFYTQKHLESRNIPWVIEWNNRARSPKSKEDADLFLLQIDYQNGTDYGYEVNYLLYNYLVYFQMKNNIRLGGFPPRP